MPTLDLTKLLSQLVYRADHPITLTSGLFLLIFPLLLLLYPLFRNRRRQQVLLLLTFSLFFYYRAGGWYLGLLLISTALDFFLARAITPDTPNVPPRRWPWIGALAANLSLLIVFKYPDQLAEIFSIFRAGQATPWNLILPLGISYFTFQKIAYLTDVYRGHFQPVTRFSDYLLYVAFFPKIIAGPIVRPKEFFFQLETPAAPGKDNLGRALFFILSGLVKKAIIADYLGVNFIDRVFAAPPLYSGLENLMAIYGYALQLYCDFSGYTDIALGTALLVGIRLPANFRSPYQATSISDFWQRWHITLLNWFRDYFFLPLAYWIMRHIQRDKILAVKTETWAYLSGMMTIWVACGVWHGAAWHFVIWGLLQGGAIFVERVFKIPRKMTKSPWRRSVGRIITFHYICLGWLFFRSESIETVKLVLGQILHSFRGMLLPQFVSGYAGVSILMALGFVLIFLPQAIKDRFEVLLIKTPLFGKSLILATVIYIVIQVQSAAIQPFIYFQF